MYFEIFRNGKLIKRGTEILNEFSWSNELMLIPSVDLTLPIEYAEYISGREEFKLYAGDKIFYGVVMEVEDDTADDVLNITVEHIISEWQNRQISVNHAVKNGRINFVFKSNADKMNRKDDEAICANNLTLKNGTEVTDAELIEKCYAQAWNTATGEELAITVTRVPIVDDEGNPTDTEDFEVRFTTPNGAGVKIKVSFTEDGKEEENKSDPSVVDQLEDIYEDANFAHPGWTINYSDDAKDTLIDYVYSRQNKLEALTKTMELTDDLFWRVDFSGEKNIDVSAFGDIKPYIVSLKPEGRTNVQILEEPKVKYDFKNVINVATVYSEKSDTGMSSLTLRGVYSDPSLQKDGFPAVILRDNVNNERDYRKYTDQYPTLAPNNELEYAVLDEESIALEAGTLIEGTYAFDDLAPFNEKDENGDTREVTDDDRVKCAETAYEAVIKKLKQSRRTFSIESLVTPVLFNVGDKVRFIYDANIFHLESCSNYMKKVMTLNDYYYVTKIEYSFDVEGHEVDTIILSKELKIDRETSNDI